MKSAYGTQPKITAVIRLQRQLASMGTGSWRAATGVRLQIVADTETPAEVADEQSAGDGEGDDKDADDAGGFAIVDAR